MDFSMRKGISRWSFTKDYLSCCKGSPESRRERKMVEKGLKKIDKELDIL